MIHAILFLKPTSLRLSLSTHLVSVLSSISAYLCITKNVLHCIFPILTSICFLLCKIRIDLFYPVYTHLASPLCYPPIIAMLHFFRIKFTLLWFDNYCSRFCTFFSSIMFVLPKVNKWHCLVGIRRFACTHH